MLPTIKIISTGLGVPQLEERVNEFMAEEYNGGNIWRAVGAFTTASGISSIVLQLEVDTEVTLYVEKAE